MRVFEQGNESDCGGYRAAVSRLDRSMCPNRNALAGHRQPAGWQPGRSTKRFKARVLELKERASAHGFPTINKCQHSSVGNRTEDGLLRDRRTNCFVAFIARVICAECWRL